MNPRPVFMDCSSEVLQTWRPERVFSLYMNLAACETLHPRDEQLLDRVFNVLNNRSLPERYKTSRTLAQQERAIYTAAFLCPAISE